MNGKPPEGAGNTDPKAQQPVERPPGPHRKLKTPSNQSGISAIGSAHQNHSNPSRYNSMVSSDNVITNGKYPERAAETDPQIQVPVDRPPGPHRKLKTPSAPPSNSGTGSSRNASQKLSRQNSMASSDNVITNEKSPERAAEADPQIQTLVLRPGPHTKLFSNENTVPSRPQDVQSGTTSKPHSAWPRQPVRHTGKRIHMISPQNNNVIATAGPSPFPLRVPTQPRNHGHFPDNAPQSNHTQESSHAMSMRRPPNGQWNNGAQFGPHNTLSNSAVRLSPAKSWEEICILLENVPREHCTPITIHAILLEYGQVSSIYCMPQTQTARVVLAFHRPALFQKPIIYCGKRLYVKRVQKEPEMVISPLGNRKTVLKRNLIPVQRLDFGVLTGEHRMMNMHTVTGTSDNPAVFVLDLASENKPRLNIGFFLTSETETPWYRIELMLNSPTTIQQISHVDGSKELVITSKYPPKWWQSVQRNQLKETHQHDRASVNNYFEWPRGWRRVTDIDLDLEDRDLQPVSFVRPSPVIDTGRWLTWKLSFPADYDKTKYNEIVGMLIDHNVRVEDVDSSCFEVVAKEEAVIWEFLDPHRALHESDLQQLQDGMMHISQDVRYQLEVCISNNKISEYSMSKEFVRMLGSMDQQRALNLLENVADSKRMIFDPMAIFGSANLQHSRRRRITKGHVLMHTAVITPTTVYVKTPTVEVSNRVIREHNIAEGNFLRIKFEDEEVFGGLMPMAQFDNQHEVWERVARCLRNGIDIAGRSYDWLACGNSQFREAGAYFFAPYDENRTAETIRNSLGDFSQIRVIAKCMARIGQCFSTTKVFTNVGSVEVQQIDDIERNGHCFTDGVGKISPFLAQMIANEFRIPTDHGFPSVFQFRMSGYKGILAVDPTLKGKIVQVRPSQTKFEAASDKLEIIRCSVFSSPTLNQQLILVLTSLGISKDTFIDKMKREIRNIDLAMTDEQMALSMLQKNVDFNQVTLRISGMILDGFLESQEPFLQANMELWRAWNLKYLKEKARIPIENGAFVFGCVDETNTLRMDDNELPEIFLQYPGLEKGEWKVAEGVCLLARNPSLHPGDIRVVRAVACPALKHLRNVVVLPQQGERPLANMCSGGDLDGDDYLVMWDDDLLPAKDGWNHPAMNYDAPAPVTCNETVQTEDLIKFFVDYIKYNNLGQIAINHRTLADRHAQSGGVKHADCLKLAELHSMAVDFNKTGVPARMEERLWPGKFPHWIFSKPKSKQYISKEVLGRLYDMVERDRYKFQPLLDNPFDDRVLGAYDLDKKMLEEVRDIKLDYDKEIRKVMAQNAIKTEFEVWTAFVMSHNREHTWYKLAEELGQLVADLKADFEVRVRIAAGVPHSANLDSKEVFDKLAPYVAAMYSITNNEVKEWKKDRLIPDADVVEGMPLISFPWLFAGVLGKIATRESESRKHVGFAAGLGDFTPRPVPKVRTRRELELDRLQLTPLTEWAPQSGTAVNDLAGMTMESTPSSTTPEETELVDFSDPPTVPASPAVVVGEDFAGMTMESTPSSITPEEAELVNISISPTISASPAVIATPSSSMMDLMGLVTETRTPEENKTSNVTDPSAEAVEGPSTMMKDSVNETDQVRDDSCVVDAEQEEENDTVGGVEEDKEEENDTVGGVEEDKEEQTDGVACDQGEQTDGVVDGQGEDANGVEEDEESFQEIEEDEGIYQEIEEGGQVESLLDRLSSLMKD